MEVGEDGAATSATGTLDLSTTNDGTSIGANNGFNDFTMESFPLGTKLVMALRPGLNLSKQHIRNEPRTPPCSRR